MDDRLDRSSSSTSGIGRSASKSTNSARSSTNSFSDTDLEYGATLTERSLAKTNQENGLNFQNIWRGSISSIYRLLKVLTRVHLSFNPRIFMGTLKRRYILLTLISVKIWRHQCPIMMQTITLHSLNSPPLSQTCRQYQFSHILLISWILHTNVSLSKFQNRLASILAWLAWSKIIPIVVIYNE